MDTKTIIAVSLAVAVLGGLVFLFIRNKQK